MFYWNHNTKSGTTLEKELTCCNTVKKVVIASAFISQEGVRILQQMKQAYSLERESIILYLSDQFSTNNPDEILEQLSDLCLVKIIFDYRFHAKVYLLKGNVNKIIYGSSNFTNGGMNSNIEFDFIGDLSDDDLKSVDCFFERCENISNELNDEIINYYRKNKIKIEELQSNQREIAKILGGFTHISDAFSPDDYNLDGYYFEYHDYETFFTRNRSRNDNGIKYKREQVRDKMLKIHENIYSDIKKLRIAPHKRKENITSLITPEVFNQYSVDWIGVRYGKTTPEIDIMNKDREKDDSIFGFQKHGSLQYCIDSDGFEVNLFFAVKHDAIDRLYLQDILLNQGKKIEKQIENELGKLKDLGLIWVIQGSNNTDRFTFNVDEEEPEKFCEFFKKNDMDGRESFLRKYYKPDDTVLKSMDDLCAEILRIMEMLLPLYNTLVWRIPLK